MIHEMMLYALAMDWGALHFDRLAVVKTRDNKDQKMAIYAI